MATQSNQVVSSDTYVDDSEFENFDGHLTRTPAPGEDHSELQARLKDLLTPLAKAMGGKALQEWSVSDGAGHWLTPDITVSFPEYQPTKRKHVLKPVYLVVEIRSEDQTLRELFGSKRMQYRQWGVPHYWLIDPAEKTCYECLPEVKVCEDELTTADFTLSVAEIFPVE